MNQTLCLNFPKGYFCLFSVAMLFICLYSSFFCFCFYYNLGATPMLWFHLFLLTAYVNHKHGFRNQSCPERCLSDPLPSVFPALSSPTSWRPRFHQFLLYSPCIVLHKLVDSWKMSYFPFLLPQNIYFYVAFLNGFFCSFSDSLFSKGHIWPNACFCELSLIGT